MELLLATGLIALLGAGTGLFINRLLASITPGKPASLPVWLLPVITAGIQATGWLQPAYQATPFYVFFFNLIPVWLLVLVAAIDLATRLIYPRLLLLLAAIALGLSVIIGRLNPVTGVIRDREGRYFAVSAGSEATHDPTFSPLWPLNPLDSFTGALVLLVVFGLFFILGRIFFGPEAVGTGDVALAGVAGLILGFNRSLAAIPLIFLAGLVAGLVVLLLERFRFTGPKPARSIAFGPFIAGGAIWILMLPGS